MAKSECDSAVKLGNAGAAGNSCLGLVNDGTGQYGEAATEFQRAIDLEPTSEDAYIGLALAFEHQAPSTKPRRRIRAPSTLIPTAAPATILWVRSISGATNTRKHWVRSRR